MTFKAKVAQTLQPLLGSRAFPHWRFGWDVDITSADQSDEVFDPQKSVIATSQTTQDVTPVGIAPPSVSRERRQTFPTPPRNRPPQPRRPATTRATPKASPIPDQPHRGEHTKLPQGSLKRLSLAVLVDHSVRFEGARRVIDPPSAEKLRVIRDLVSAATGLDTKRGDQLVVGRISLRIHAGWQPNRRRWPLRPRLSQQAFLRPCPPGCKT